jgi:hypothetical protein
MVSLKLKMALAGPMEYAAGDTIEMAEADAIRMVLRGVGICVDKEGKEDLGARRKLLANVSAEQQALIIAARVRVTRKKGRPIDGDPNGGRTWADADGKPYYRMLTPEDLKPKRERTIGEKIKAAARKLQRKAYGPPREAAGVK